MLAILLNINLDAAYSGYQYPVRYSMLDHEEIEYRHLSNGVYVKLVVNDPVNWSVRESVPTIVSEVIAYPNPFILRENSTIHFRLPSAVASIATLTIFNSAMEMVSVGEASIVGEQTFEPTIAWNGRGEHSTLIGSGIYFFSIHVDNNFYSGKFSVIRDQ